MPWRHTAAGPGADGVAKRRERAREFRHAAGKRRVRMRSWPLGRAPGGARSLLAGRAPRNPRRLRAGEGRGEGAVTPSGRLARLHQSQPRREVAEALFLVLDQPKNPEGRRARRGGQLRLE